MRTLILLLLGFVLVSGCLNSTETPEPPSRQRTVQEISENANTLFDEGNYSNSAREYTLLLNRINSEGLSLPDEELADVYAFRGLSYFNTEKYDLALKDYDAALKLNPNFSILYISRAQAHYALGDEAAMKADVERAKAAGVDINEILGTEE